MKHVLIMAAALGVVATWGLVLNGSAQERGQCYFVASQDIYLKIYHLDKDGVERRAVWTGHLPEGATKAFDARYGQVGYATRETPEDPWEENQEECMNGEAIEIP